MGHFDLDCEVRWRLNGQIDVVRPTHLNSVLRKVKRLIPFEAGIQVRAAKGRLACLLPRNSERARYRLDKLAQTLGVPIVFARFAHKGQSPIAVDHPDTDVLVECGANRHVSIPTDCSHYE